MITQESIMSVVGSLQIPFRYSDVLPENFHPRVLALREKGARVEIIGKSRSKNFLLYGVVVGDETKPTIALTGNNHAEEVIGCFTILTLLEDFLAKGPLYELLKDFRIVALPQMNPDGVMRNQVWLSDPTPKNNLAFFYRDMRSEDVEHGIGNGQIPFQRSEPKALAEFLTKEAVGRTPMYLTFHSSVLEPGSFFLTANEDEGIMGPGWDIIRSLATWIGMSLADENLNGYYGFRRIREGLYSVPRHAEMSEYLKASGADASEFLLNSVEFMEQRGTLVSLVSEVPVLSSPVYNESPLISKVPALTFFAPQVAIYQDHVMERSELLAKLNGEWRGLITDEQLLSFRTRQHEKWKRFDAQDIMGQFQTFYGRPALRYHEARLASLPAQLEVERAGMVISLLQPRMERDRWEEKLEKAYQRLNSVLHLSMTPIEKQVKMQLLLVLAGAKVIEERK